MQTVSLVQAVVKYPVDRVRNTQYGERIKAVLTADDGSDIELWGKPGDPVNYLKRGERVALTWDGKKYILIATHPEPGNGHQATTRPTAPSDPPTQSVAAKSSDVAEYIAIFRELRAALPDCSEQTWRAAASTLMMIRCKAREVDF